jgi:hypothetical protein
MTELVLIASLAGASNERQALTCKKIGFFDDGATVSDPLQSEKSFDDGTSFDCKPSRSL